MNNPWIQRIGKSHRKVAHEALDEAIDDVKTVRARPVWRAVNRPVKQHLRQSLSLLLFGSSPHGASQDI